MVINDSYLENGEKIMLALREKYVSAGYKPYKMSKFEEYDLYARNKDFLVSDNVITFTDTNGKLLALKPDVTLSIIKNSKDDFEGTQKVYYNENVYRVSDNNNSFSEIMQTGLECFGKVTDDDIAEVITLAAESISMLTEKCVIDLSDLEMIEKAVASTKISSPAEKKLYKAIEEKNLHEIMTVCSENGASVEGAELLRELVGISGKFDDIKDRLSEICEKIGASAEFEKFSYVVENVLKKIKPDMLNIDFSVADDVNYYNGIVFKGYICGIPNTVVSGGQYDRLMSRMKRKSKAIGFAVYLDALERLDTNSEKADEKEDEYLNIALPKGRLGERVYAMFALAGFECPAILEPNRKLIFENEDTKVRYFWVKPSDVAIYVERGAADIGVVGKDILLEYEPDVYELLDLDTGKCRMAVAAPKAFVDDPSKTLRVATKFTNIARSFYQSKGRDIDIIHLNGSIEIAPILGLSDVIVDIVETGATLRENDLEVKETIVPISARLISNKSSMKFKARSTEKLVRRMAEVLEEKKND